MIIQQLRIRSPVTDKLFGHFFGVGHISDIEDGHFHTLIVCLGLAVPPFHFDGILAKTDYMIGIVRMQIITVAGNL